MEEVGILKGRLSEFKAGIWEGSWTTAEGEEAEGGKEVGEGGDS